MKRHISVSILLFVLMGVPNLTSAEGLMLFPNQDLNELSLIATDPETGSFSFQDNYGEIQDGTIGDVIGVQEAKVLEVDDISITTATYEEYNWYGTKRIRTNLKTITKERTLTGGKGLR